MKKRIIDLCDGEPSLDIVSYGRGGQPLTSAQLAEIKRVVHSAPEVMVKVSGGARTLAGVARHVRYIGREGELEMETDMGQSVRGRDLGETLIRDWESQREWDLANRTREFVGRFAPVQTDREQIMHMMIQRARAH